MKITNIISKLEIKYTIIIFFSFSLFYLIHYKQRVSVTKSEYYDKIILLLFWEFDLTDPLFSTFSFVIPFG